MQKKSNLFEHILKNKQELNVQIVYTQINRGKNGLPKFTTHSFNTNKQNYFYPASTVKMPIAFLALEKLNELKIKGLDMNTTMITDSNYYKQSVVYNQPTANNGKPTIANYIKQIFLVSDNDAFNRLYEFLGQDYIMRKLKEKGYNATVRHRLQLALTTEENKHTNAVYFYSDDGKLIYKQPAQYNKNEINPLKVRLGKGYYKNGMLINEPFDFSEKNQVYLEELHQMLQSVVFYKYWPSNKKFLLSEKDLKFVLHWLKSYPAESDYPPYDTAHYWDTYCKFLYYGSEKCNVNPNIKIYNKVGDAYGFLIDVAYITNESLGIEFMLSAAISCNTDGIYNDDKYEYDTIGFPFMRDIGKTIYEYELNRKKVKKSD
ncbi:MAG: serine hydrolase [Chitinophagaceae bacterium]